MVPCRTGVSCTFAAVAAALALGVATPRSATPGEKYGVPIAEWLAAFLGGEGATAPVKALCMCSPCGPRKGIGHAFRLEDAERAFRDFESMVVVTAGAPMADPNFERVFLWVEHVPLFASSARGELHLTTQQAKDILVGRLTNWDALGQPESPIHLMAVAQEVRKPRILSFLTSLRDGSREAVPSRLPGGEPKEAVALRPTRDEPKVAVAPIPPSDESKEVAAAKLLSIEFSDSAKTHDTLALKAAARSDTVAISLPLRKWKGLSVATIDGIAPDGGLLAQPAMFWRFMGIDPKTIPTEPKEADNRVLIEETSLANPDPPTKEGEPKRQPEAWTKKIYPLRQSVYLFIRRTEPGRATLNPKAAELAKDWLLDIRKQLAATASE